MLRRWALLGLAVALLVAAPYASAQNYDRQTDAARTRLREALPQDRFDLAAGECNGAAEIPNVTDMLVWCNLAVRTTIDHRAHDHRQEYSPQEREVLLRAAWLQAMHGIQHASFFSGPQIESVNLGATTEPRLAAYALFGHYRDRDTSGIVAQSARLVRSIGLDDSVVYKSMAATRADVIDGVLGGERTPDRLWAAAIIGLTLGYEWRRGDNDGSARLIAESAALAPKLALLVETQPQDLESIDASLRTMLDFAYGRTLLLANDFAHATPILERAAKECATTVFSHADACIELSMETAVAQASADFELQHPGLMERSPEVPLSASTGGNEEAEVDCRAIVVGDVADEGTFTNLRVPFAYPSNTCTNMAMRYVAHRLYPTRDQGDPERRRQNIIVRFVLRMDQ